MELNKIFAALLVAGIISLGSAILADALYTPDVPAEQAFIIAVPEDEEAAADAAEAEAEEVVESVLPLMADADPAAGEDLSRACAACHSFDEGGPNLVGPNNWDVVGSVMGHIADFNYSDALQERHDAGDIWSYASLDAFLLNPQAYLPGTSMVYAGIPDVQDRANLIAWLRTLSSDPFPLPTPEEISAVTGETETGEAPAEEAAAEEVASDETAAADAEETAPAEEAAPEEAATEETAAASTAEEPAAEEVVTEEAAAAEDTTAEETTTEEAAAETETAEAPSETAETTEETAAAEETATADEAAATEETAAAEETAAVEETAADPAAEETAAAPADAGPGWDTPAALAERLAAADPANGQAEAAICMACHNFDPGGPNLVGPNNWDVVGSVMGHVESFNYTQGLQDRHAAGDVWTYQSLDDYLAAPMQYIPETSMAFAGVADDQARADIIAWLRSLSDNPVPLP